MIVKPVIKTSEHVLICGQTGSGKTKLAEVYLAGFINVIALDTKGTLKWLEAGEVPVFTTLSELMQFKEGKAIYRPRWEEMTPEYYDKFFEWCYKRGNTTVWVDEVMSICPNASTIPPFYKAILTRGRELNVSVWSLTQRPKTIPMVVMTEASHFFVFRLNAEDDRKRISEVTGLKDLMKIPAQFQFWYFNTLSERPILAKLKL